MEGSVTVKKVTSTIPDYPVDASGQRQSIFPVHTLTKDDKYDIDMAWSPTVLLAGDRVSFIMDFSDPITNKRHHLLPYDFVIYQDGTEVLRKASLSQDGSDVQEVIFSKSGPVNIRVENIGADKGSFTEFNGTYMKT